MILGIGVCAGLFFYCSFKIIPKKLEKKNSKKKNYIGSWRLGCILVLFLRLIFNKFTSAFYRICNLPPVRPSSFCSRGIDHFLRLLSLLAAIQSVQSTRSCPDLDCPEPIFLETHKSPNVQLLKCRRKISYWPWHLIN